MSFNTNKTASIVRSVFLMSWLPALWNMHEAKYFRSNEIHVRCKWGQVSIWLLIDISLSIWSVVHVAISLVHSLTHHIPPPSHPTTCLLIATYGHANFNPARVVQNLQSMKLVTIVSFSLEGNELLYIIMYLWLKALARRLHRSSVGLNH